MYHRRARLTCSRTSIVRPARALVTAARSDPFSACTDPNIVQYRGFIKTSTHLYIILEYCENGSLHGITKKFGRFPESLVALYILQVLQGLVYLHDQGVIHRDIKGSNILANKEGGIKRKLVSAEKGELGADFRLFSDPLRGSHRP